MESFLSASPGPFMLRLSDPGAPTKSCVLFLAVIAWSRVSSPPGPFYDLLMHRNGGPVGIWDSKWRYDLMNVSHYLVRRPAAKRRKQQPWPPPGKAANKCLCLQPRPKRKGERYWPHQEHGHCLHVPPVAHTPHSSSSSSSSSSRTL